MSSGELSFESASHLLLTWTIPDFLRLATESEYSLLSPDFTFADSLYCLRLFQYRSRPSDRIIIELLNSIDTDPGRAVSYDVELKSRSKNNPVYRDVEDKKVFYIERSYLECQRDVYVPDGTLTVICSVRSREPDSGGSPKCGVAHTGVFPKYRMTGKLSSESFPFLYVTWRIPAFFQPTWESERRFESSEFPFTGRRYLLLFIKHEYAVQIELVNLTHRVPGRYVSFEVGLKSTTGEEIEIKSCGTSTKRQFYILRSALDDMQPVHFSDGELTVFCCMRSREPSSAGSPKSGGDETSDEEDDEEASTKTCVCM